MEYSEAEAHCDRVACTAQPLSSPSTRYRPGASGKIKIRPSMFSKTCQQIPIPHGLRQSLGRFLFGSQEPCRHHRGQQRPAYEISAWGRQAPSCTKRARSLSRMQTIKKAAGDDTRARHTLADGRSTAQASRGLTAMTGSKNGTGSPSPSRMGSPVTLSVWKTRSKGTGSS